MKNERGQLRHMFNGFFILQAGLLTQQIQRRFDSHKLEGVPRLKDFIHRQSKQDFWIKTHFWTTPFSFGEAEEFAHVALPCLYESGIPLAPLWL